MTAMRAHSSTCVVRSGRSCGRMRPYEATGCPSMVQHHVFHIRSELYRRIGCCSGVDVDKKVRHLSFRPRHGPEASAARF